MNQRGAVKAAWIMSILGIVLALLSLPSFVGAAADGADCDRPGAILIDTELRNPNRDRSRPDHTIDLAQTITAGTYSVTLVSFDDHSISSPEQTEEQWFAELVDAGGGVVYRSVPTRDLPDGENFVTDNYELQPVTGTATRLRAVHRAAGTSVNSIIALCALFTRVEAGRIIVQKVTEPAGEPQRFTFTADYAAFELGGGEQHDSGLILAGMHSVSEEAVGGWETSATCSDGSPPDAIGLQDGEIVTCIFTNTESTIDLIVTLDDAPRGQAATEPIVTPGDPFDYVVNVLNLGPEGADNVEAVLTMSDEVVVDTTALDPGCVPAGTDEIVCSLGVVPVGEIITVRVAVRMRADSFGIGTLVTAVIVGAQDFPGESIEADNRDVEPTTFPVPRIG